MTKHERGINPEEVRGFLIQNGWVKIDDKRVNGVFEKFRFANYVSQYLYEGTVRSGKESGLFLLWFPEQFRSHFEYGPFEDLRFREQELRRDGWKIVKTGNIRQNGIISETLVALKRKEIEVPDFPFPIDGKKTRIPQFTS